MANEYTKVLKNGFSRRSEIVAAINKSSDSVKTFTKNLKFQNIIQSLGDDDICKARCCDNVC